jgi:hypothetical protein
MNEGVGAGVRIEGEKASFRLFGKKSVRESPRCVGEATV